MQLDDQPLVVWGSTFTTGSSGYFAPPELVNANTLPTSGTTICDQCIVYIFKASDMWSIGVILFKIFFGSYSLIQQQAVNVPSHPNAELRDLIQCLLQVDPATRPSAEEALAHPLFLRSGHINLNANPRSTFLNQKLDLVRSFTAEMRQKMRHPRSDNNTLVVTVHSDSFMESLFDSISKYFDQLGETPDHDYCPALLEVYIHAESGSKRMTTNDMYRLFFREVLKEEAGLFEKSANGSCYIPRVSTPLSSLGIHAQQQQLKRLRVVGFLLMRVLFEECTVNCPLAPSVWKYLLNKSPNNRDLEIYDPLLFKSLLQKLNLPFVDNIGSYEGIAESGEKILFNEDNSSLLDYKAEKLLVSARKQQLEAIRQGFQSDKHIAAHLSLLRVDDIQILLGMHNYISFQMVAPLLEFHHFPTQSQAPKYFLECIAHMDTIDLRRFLLFACQRSSLFEAFEFVPLHNANRGSTFPPNRITIIPKETDPSQISTVTAVHSKISHHTIELQDNQTFNELHDGLLSALQDISL
jgi:serine/threonine protein kinase